MKQLIIKLTECIAVILPFLKKKNAKEIREFSELIMDQYTFLVDQLEKVLKDYFELSDKVKEMHAEIFRLREEIARATTPQ
ncbi:hypothetical protein [Bacteroides sp. 224]|uniref:hypothetical protein n=1 Tax=Bacteroides sp. 224 TaxID=2302936 RepID=UPI0013D363B1|nr:hypothetical protein [Bacteroides sp. 224]NDV64547.1 hypothetical protein [Bacteroides sp. 224]